MNIMTRWILRSFFVSALAFAYACGGETPPATPAPAAPATAEPAPTTKPAAPTPEPATPASEPAAPATKPAADATPGTSAKSYGPGIYAHFTTSRGNFIVRFFDKDAPITVQNFVGLAEGKKAWTDPRTGRQVRRAYFTNVLFHRVIPNFMIQGGDPTGTGTGGPGYKFDNEISPKHKHDRAGIVSMANSGPDTNGSQFFVTVAPYPSLDGNYSIFGEVVDGLPVVVGISKVPRSPGDNRPLTDVVIKSVRIERVS
jgi:peptidyl-prolyl cis-trans isomerase A (cyclophilin A)